MPALSEMILKPTLPVENSACSPIQPTTVLFQSSDRISSPLQYRNSRLEKLIHAKQNKLHLSLVSMELIDHDMEIVAYYISRNDTVRNIRLSYLLRKNNRNLFSTIFEIQGAYKFKK
jgi:hypothetical protein